MKLLIFLFFYSCGTTTMLKKINDYDEKAELVNTERIKVRKKVFTDTRSKAVLDVNKDLIVYVEGYDLQNGDMLGMLISKKEAIKYINFKYTDAESVTINDDTPYFSKWFITKILNDEFSSIEEESKLSGGHGGYSYSAYLFKDQKLKKYKFKEFSKLQW